jgi:hypothetical protein
MRPGIGGIFALAVFVFVESPLVPLAAASKSDTYLLVALGFLAGFSERFAQDVFVRSGQGLTGPGGDAPEHGAVGRPGATARRRGVRPPAPRPLTRSEPGEEGAHPVDRLRELLARGGVGQAQVVRAGPAERRAGQDGDAASSSRRAASSSAGTGTPATFGKT